MRAWSRSSQAKSPSASAAPSFPTSTRQPGDQRMARIDLEDALGSIGTLVTLVVLLQQPHLDALGAIALDLRALA
jgi:hypothetical protein